MAELAFESMANRLAEPLATHRKNGGKQP
jgi:hypothetical protein